MDSKCKECGATEDETKVRKCPVCHKEFCEDHSFQRSGLWFCTRGCADYFFFADPDD